MFAPLILDLNISSLAILAELLICGITYMGFTEDAE
jgi:hypothetical protein